MKHLIAPMALAIAATSAAAQDTTRQTVALPPFGEMLVISDRITGYESVDYVIDASAGQIISVDLQSDGAAAYFNILPDGDPAAIFVGSTEGNVADVAAPADGTYLVRVYQMRASARRDEVAQYSVAVALTAPEMADGLNGGPDYWAVTGISVGSSLNLREGPDTRYAVVGQLDRGDTLQNRGCRMSGPTRWCDVRETGTGLTGWVAGQFLTETAAPPPPASDADGPVGIGIPFDATGRVTCSIPAGAAPASCPFGVIRQGPGNAGVWITLPDREVQQLLFEGGALVTGSPAQTFTADREGDTFIVNFGPNRFEVPDAVIFGG